MAPSSNGTRGAMEGFDRRFRLRPLIPSQKSDQTSPTLYEWAGGLLSLERHLTQAQRERWMSLLLSTAGEVGLPDDPEFRSALVAYLEWGSRLAVINSQPGAAAEAALPVPCWNWGVPGAPYRP